MPCAHLISSSDDSEWVVLLFEDIEGRHPVTPWRENELRAVLEALDAVARATTPLTESRLPEAADVYAQDFGRCAELEPAALLRFDPWLAQPREHLVSRGGRAGRLVNGDALGHGDLRADNLLVQPDGRVRIVDWPNACRSAPWIDGVLLAVNVENLGGLRAVDGTVIDCLPVLTQWASTHGASPDDVLDVLVGMLAYYTWASMQPDVPGLPTLRRDQGVAARAALRSVRRIWPAE